jgi:hypothetical protein
MDVASRESKRQKGEMFYFWVYVGGKGVEKY